MHQLRRSLKAEVQACLADLRAMQQLQRELEEGQVLHTSTANLSRFCHSCCCCCCCSVGDSPGVTGRAQAYLLHASPLHQPSPRPQLCSCTKTQFLPNRGLCMLLLCSLQCMYLMLKQAATVVGLRQQHCGAANNVPSRHSAV